MIGAHILREYDIKLHVHEKITCLGDQCEHCQETDSTVAAIVHATDFDGYAIYEEACLACVITLIDRCLDIDPDRPVIIEIAA